MTVLRMEVPCCGGLQRAVETDAANSGKNIPVTTKIVTTDGKVR